MYYTVRKLRRKDQSNERVYTLRPRRGSTVILHRTFRVVEPLRLAIFELADLESGALSIRNPQPEIRNPQLTVLQPVLARAGSGKFLIVRHENGSQPVLEMQ